MENKFFPLFVNLENKNILVVGAGNIALRKVNTLLKCSANIKVITKSVGNEGFILLKEKNKIELLENTEFRAEYLENIFLVVAATDNKELNKSIFEICNSKNILVNNITSKEEMNVRFSSIFETEEFQIGISAKGNPKRAMEIKNKIRKILEK